MFTHIRESTAGADGVVVAHPALVVWVLSSGQNVLVAGVVGLLVQHPASALHLNRVAAAEVGVHIRAVGVTLIGAALEVSVLVKYDLSPGEKAEAEEESDLRLSQWTAASSAQIHDILCWSYKPCTSCFGNVVLNYGHANKKKTLF